MRLMLLKIYLGSERGMLADPGQSVMVNLSLSCRRRLSRPEAEWKGSFEHLGDSTAK